jgi:hypothetical protein
MEETGYKQNTVLDGGIVESSAKPQAAHFLLGSLLVEAFCWTGLTFNILGIDGLPFILIAITLLAVFGAGYLGLQSYRNWGNMNMRLGFMERLKVTKR